MEVSGSQHLFLTAFSKMRMCVLYKPRKRSSLTMFLSFRSNGLYLFQLFKKVKWSFFLTFTRVINSQFLFRSLLLMRSLLEPSVFTKALLKCGNMSCKHKKLLKPSTKYKEKKTFLKSIKIKTFRPV